MNNYEHIMQGGIDALVEYGEQCTKDRCSVCIFDKQDQCNPFCSEGARKWLKAEYIEPESREKIWRDAKKSFSGYWNCDIDCEDCPAKINGENPDDYYAVDSCRIAQTLDVLTRLDDLIGADKCTK